MIREILRRIEEDEETGCWLWTGNMHHGLPRVNDKSKNMPVSARRAAYELTEGPVPAGWCVGRNLKCDERCVNPNHSVLRSKKAQMKVIRPLAYKEILLTAAKISATKRAKSRFTDAQIAQMRRDMAEIGTPKTAEKWGVSRSYAYYIKINRYRADPLSLGGMLAQMRRAA